MPEMPEELAALLETGRDVRIPISSPDPVTDDDAERLYSMTDECTLGSDADGPYVSVEENAGTIQRVLGAMSAAGFQSVFHEALSSPGAGTSTTE